MIRYEPFFDLSVPDIAFFGEVGKGDLGYAPCDDHMHRHIEFHHILSGSETFIVDGDEFTVTDSPGGFVMIFPYQVHNNSVNTTCRHISGTISPEILRSPDTLSKYRPASAYVPESALPPFFFDLLMWAGDLHLTMTDKNRAAKKPLILGAARLIVDTALNAMTLVPRNSETGRNRIPAIGRVINYCVTHMGDDLSLDAVADALFLDKYYISKLFPAKLGVGYVEFVRSQRISKACEMLKSGDMSITDISYECGFRNQSTFNRVFREMTGMSPREYRTEK